MKYKKTIWCIILFSFYFFYRFIIEGKTDAKDYYTITSYTSNGHGYLHLISIATFNCFIYLLFVNAFINKPSVQFYIRIKRTVYFLKNELRLCICTVIFNLCYFLPHIFFYMIYYGIGSMNEINFFEVLICQFFALFLYYLLISNIYMLIYIKTFRLYISILIAFILSLIFVFSYIVFNIPTPIMKICIFSDYYESNVPLYLICKNALFSFLPAVTFLILLNLFQIKNKDIIGYEN